MKVNRTYSIDVEVVDKLSEENNASLLINGLLKDYYGSSRESIDRRRRTIEKDIAILNAEEGEVSIVEEKTERENAMRERIEKEVSKKREGYNKEKKTLTKKANKKEITFDEYMELSRQLKEKWGL